MFCHGVCVYVGELSLDGGSDSYYEYLIKSYLQSGKTDQRALRLFNDLAQVCIVK